MLPNIIFIIIDSLRADVLRSYDSQINVTNNIDKLAEDGVLFKNAYTCFNATDPSLTTIFTGRYPMSHGIRHHGHDVKKEEINELYKSAVLFLPEVLVLNGYITIAIDWLDRWHKTGYLIYDWPGKRRKYARILMDKLDRFVPRLILRNLRRINNLIQPERNEFGVQSAKELTDLAINYLYKINYEPFYLFIHFWDSHFPYNDIYYNYIKDEDIAKSKIKWRNLNKLPVKRKRYLEKKLGDLSKENILRRYLSSIYFIDHNIGRLLREIKKMGYSKNIVVIMADHGEDLGEHGVLTHYELYESVIKVPLIMYGSNIPKGRVIEKYIQLVDVFPTLLDILNIEPKARVYFDGKSCFSSLKKTKSDYDTFIYAEGYGFINKENIIIKECLRINSYKLIVPEKINSSYNKKFIELYDLNNDKDEIYNISESKPKTVIKLLEELRIFKSKINKRKLKLRKYKLLRRIKKLEKMLKRKKRCNKQFS